MTERDRRVVIIGGSVVLTAVLVLRVLPATVRLAIAAEGRLRDRAALLARARADLAEAAMLRDSAIHLSQALVGLAPKILSGNTTAEAVADLSGRVHLVASNHHAKLDRVDPLTDTVHAGRLQRASLRGELTCDVRGLVEVLHTLEFGKASLAVTNLRVTVADPGSPDTSPEVLQVDMTVTGWFLASRAAGNGTVGP